MVYFSQKVNLFKVLRAISTRVLRNIACIRENLPIALSSLLSRSLWPLAKRKDGNLQQKIRACSQQGGSRISS